MAAESTKRSNVVAVAEEAWRRGLACAASGTPGLQNESVLVVLSASGELSAEKIRRGLAAPDRGVGPAPATAAAANERFRSTVRGRIADRDALAAGLATTIEFESANAAGR
jgi:hypothetical protein